MSTAHPSPIALGDYADDAVADAERRQIEDHLASCGECRATAEGLTLVRDAARRMPPMEPRHEIWARIERSLTTDTVRVRAPKWPWVALAAALIVASAGAVRVANEWRQPPAVEDIAAGTDTATAQSIEAELLQAEQHYQKAIAGLEQIANAETPTLDPQTASTLERNLAVVDQAISESRAAVRAQPASEPAQASLLDNFKTKIALLEDTIALVNEMRTGPGTGGAARIVSGFQQKDR